ncbi:Phosphoglucosamine mutase [Buchnera aphidicola (Protaphis terricola)]
MKNFKYFKTDGIRGQVGKYPITPNFMLKLGQIISTVLGGDKKKIVIGRDTRISGCMLQYALEFGILSKGVSTYLVGCIPTPAIAYLTKSLNASAGIIISASHNLFHDNGVKIFFKNGSKINSETEILIENMLCDPLYDSSYVKIFGYSHKINNAVEKYISFCKNTIPKNVNLSKFTIVLDCANGSTYNIAPKIFKDLGANVITASVFPNGVNINKNSGSTHTVQLKKLVILNQADLGLAFDGDGDRIIMIDHLGNQVNGDQIIYIIAKQYLKNNKLNGGVVGTLMTNMGVILGLKKIGIPFFATNVGDRYIYQTIKEKNWILGAEQSGHIILLDKHSTGDGIIASLQILFIMIKNNLSLYCLSNQVTLFPQILLNIFLKKNNNFINNIKFQSLIEKSKHFLGKSSRILIRKSGTESCIRIMIEGKNYSKVKKIAYKILHTTDLINI